MKFRIHRLGADGWAMESEWDIDDVPSVYSWEKNFLLDRIGEGNSDDYYIKMGHTMYDII